MKAKEGICIVSFSNNSDHQEFLYSLYTALKGKTNAWTVGIKRPKATNACYDEHNIYVDCPDRPGVQADTFRFDRVLKIAALIRKMNAVARYYVHPECRDSVDADILVSLEQEAAIHDFLRQKGFNVSRRSLTSHHAECHHPKYGLIEVHVHLYDEIVTDIKKLGREIPKCQTWKSVG